MKSSKKTGAQIRKRDRIPGSLRSEHARVRKEFPSCKNATLKDVRGWIEKGYNLSNEDALMADLQRQQRDPKNIKLPPDEVKTQTAIEKLLKIRAERETKEIELAEKKGLYVHITRHNEILTRCALRVKQEAQRIVTEPPGWAGLPPEELDRRGRSIFEAIQRGLENGNSY